MDTASENRQVRIGIRRKKRQHYEHGESSTMGASRRRRRTDMDTRVSVSKMNNTVDFNQLKKSHLRHSIIKNHSMSVLLNIVANIAAHYFGNLRRTKLYPEEEDQYIHYVAMKVG